MQTKNCASYFGLIIEGVKNDGNIPGPLCTMYGCEVLCDATRPSGNRSHICLRALSGDCIAGSKDSGHTKTKKKEDYVMQDENILEHKIIQQIIELTKKKQLKWYGLGSDEIGYEASVNSQHRLTLRKVGGYATLLLWHIGESDLGVMRCSQNCLNELYLLAVAQGLLFTQKESCNWSVLHDVIEGMEAIDVSIQNNSSTEEDDEEEEKEYAYEFDSEKDCPWTLRINADIMYMCPDSRKFLCEILNLCDAHLDKEYET